MRTTEQKAVAFQALHQRDGAFIIPNPYDVGSAHLLSQLGFEALATTSAGFAFTLGRRDYTLTREQVLTHVAELVAATDLPVSADLEGGFGDRPEDVAETYRLAVATGLAGGSLEDSTRDENKPIYDLTLAVERVRAVAEVVKSLPYPFMLTARCENFLVGRHDLDDTIKRLQAYQEAGADVLYAPLLRTREEITAVVSAVDRPTNVLMGWQGIDYTLAELAEMGVKRISVGSGLARVAVGAFLRASREMREQETFTFANDAISSLSQLFES